MRTPRCVLVMRVRRANLSISSGVSRRCAHARECYNSRQAFARATEPARINSSTSMKLYTAATSPYARKVRIVLLEKKIECEYIDANPYDPQTTVPQVNPLGKIPALI